MRPRLVLDIGWSDLLAGVGTCAFAGARERRAQALESSFGGNALAVLSVRSAFDLYLAARAFPEGSEVLVSALTIPDMPKVLRGHGLVPVPVDLDPSTLAPSRASLERAVTARTRALLVAHLFGSRFDMQAIVDFARPRKLEVWEDGAQAFTGDDWRGHPESDLVLWSFGTIKTATALGGGVARVRDGKTLERMGELAAAWPLQSRAHFAGKTAKALVLKALGTRALFTPFARVLALLGKDRDEFLHGIVRGFPGPDFFTAIRKRPSAPLLALLERRLASGVDSRVELRARAGKALEARLPDALGLAGARAPVKTHWVFALRSQEPERLVERLRAAGFDATRRSSLRVVEAPSGRASASEASALLEEVVFVPLVPREAHDFPRLVRALEGAQEELAEFELVPARRRDAVRPPSRLPARSREPSGEPRV